MAHDCRTEFRGYDLVACQHGFQQVKGQLWLDNKSVHCCEGTTLQEVIEQLRVIVKNIISLKRRTKTTADADEYVWAFRKIAHKITHGHQAMLQAHYHAENRILTARQLACAAGYATHGAANLQYGKLGRMISELLYVTQIPHERTKEPIWTSRVRQLQT